MRKLKSTCKMCKATGQILINERPDGAYDLVDKIKHRYTCPKIKKQPLHFRKKKWREQEKRAALVILGKETPLSGALNEDGDARRLKGWRVECKRSESSRYRVTQAIWSKLVKGALENGEEPALFVDVEGGKHRFVLVRVEGSADARSTSITAKTRYGEVLPLSPSARVLSPKEFKQRVDDEAKADARRELEGKKEA